MKPDNDLQVAVLIATANRPQLLGERAIPAIERQNLAPAQVVVVHDVANDEQAERTKEVVAEWQRRCPAVELRRNTRAKGAAGAWNDGLDRLLRTAQDPTRLYVAVLDDDDEWEADHLATCVQTARRRQLDMVAAPFWRHEDGADPKCKFPPEHLDAADFLIGNPGIQGSNLFCRLSVLLEAGLFDEWLPSCTDRDLCIRIAELPGVLYGTTARPTVRHYADAGRRRLSSPESPAKKQGLDRFFRKYQGRMTAEQERAFRERAQQLFDWQGPSAGEREGRALRKKEPSAGEREGRRLACETPPRKKKPSEPPAPRSSASAGEPPETPSHLIVGTIADTGALGDLGNLLEDLRRFAAEPRLAGLDVVVLENGRTPRPCRALRDLVRRERDGGMRVHLVDRARHIEDARSGLVPDAGASAGAYLPIAPARTVLQSYLYAFAKGRDGAIVWIVDDDLRLDPLVVDERGRFQRSPLPLVPALHKLKTMRGKEADVVIGRCTGAPPVPFAATVRVQMVDLMASLQWLATLPPQGALPDRAAENRDLRTDRRDYYYDLSRTETDRLETPFWITPAHTGERVDEAFTRIARKAVRILAGEQLFRPLATDAAADPLAIADGLQRGGNTFVLDVETLRLGPNLAPAIDGRRTRRSDMMWALLQERYFGRKVVTMPGLALHQDRSLVDVGELDVERVVDDMRGYALFSALEGLTRGSKHRLGPAAVEQFSRSVRKYLRERLAAFRLSFHRVRGLAGAVRALVGSGAFWWRSGAYADARAGLQAFCDRLDGAYTLSALAEIERRVAQLKESELRAFIGALPDEIERHQARLADVSRLRQGFQDEREANAKAVARRLARPAGQLGVLGCGSEGVALTDGEFVYKVFDYWKSWHLEATLAYLRELVGAWRHTRSLYPLVRLHEEGRDVVLVYRYEESDPYAGGHGPGLVELLVECWEQGIVCRNIHPDNLRVVRDRVRLVDYGSDIRRLTDSADSTEFETMCQRAWLSFRYADRPDLKALMRRALRRPACETPPRMKEPSAGAAREGAAREGRASRMKEPSAGEREGRAPRMKELDGFERFLEAVRKMTGQRRTCQDLALALVDAPRRVLDYGCGNGRLAKTLADRGAEVLGYDPDEPRWKRWRPLCDGVGNLRFTNHRDRVLGAGKFDLVICQRVLCTIEKDDEMRVVLADLKRAVSDDGRVIVTVCDPNYTFAGPTPEAERQLPAGVRPHHTFAWRKTVRGSARVRKDVHRPERALLAAFYRVGLQVHRRLEVPTVDLVKFDYASDHVAFELRPA